MPLVARRSLVALLILLLVWPARLSAHNYGYHDSMTDLSFQIMLAIAKGDPRFANRPPNVTAGEWAAFVSAVKTAVPRLQRMPSALPERTLACIQAVEGGSNTVSSGWSTTSLGKVQHAVASSYLSDTSDCGAGYDYRGGSTTPSMPVSRDFSGITWPLGRTYDDK